MKTFWLYVGERIVASARLPHDSSHAQVVAHCLKNHNACPSISHLYPAHTPFEIATLIRQAEVRT